MSKKITNLSSKMVVTKTRNKVITCSTPEHRSESPSRDSDSLCDSEAASPVPFLCTQDGAEGETDVVWNFYTPKAEHAPTSRFKNTTPLSRKAKKSLNPRLIEKPITKRRTVKPSQKKTELFQDLIELNQNLHELISKKSSKVAEKSGSEEDIFNDSGDCSPKSGLKTNSRCLRRNVLSSKFVKQEPDTALESDDSMNECLIKASQVVEENILKESTPAKRTCYVNTSKSIKNFRTGINLDNDSMDAILNSIKLDSPLLNKTKNCDSPKLNNDSFDSLVGNLNDSALERLTQMPVRNNANKSKLNSSNADWTVQDVVLHEESPSNKSLFGRHNSMPESPSLANNKPSTSGMAFGRYNSMPYKNNGDSPIRCTPDEIKKKHQQAREKLLAKRLLPFTSTQQSSQQTILSTQSIIQSAPKKNQFQPRVASSTVNNHHCSSTVNISTNIQESKSKNNTTDIKLLIEKKRQEALMKLRRRQPQNNL